MAFLNRDGFNFYFEKFDNGTDDNVLFIHGNLAHSQWWHPSIEHLNQGPGAGKILCADWRGYGQSKGVTDTSQINFETFADDYLALIEAQGLKEIHVVGHSTGGLIAMLAILKKPELFKSLVLLDSVGPKGLELPAPKEQVLAHFEQMSVNKDYCFTVLAATITGCDAQSDSIQKLFETTFQSDKPMWQGVIDVLSRGEIDITDQMSQIQLPTLIFHGDQDMVLPMKGSEELHAMLPHSQLKVLKGYGHSYNMEDSKSFTNDLKAFWGSL